MRQLLEQTLSANGLRLTDISGLASLAHKCQEPGLVALAASLAVPLAGFEPAQLTKVLDRVSALSAVALRSTGVASVAEACALAQVQALGGQRSQLLISKHSSAQATVAVAGVEEEA